MLCLVDILPLIIPSCTYYYCTRTSNSATKMSKILRHGLFLGRVYLHLGKILFALREIFQNLLVNVLCNFEGDS